jgi:Tol biopolymer transport system component
MRQIGSGLQWILLLCLGLAIDKVYPMAAQTADFQENLYFTVTALAWSPDTSRIAVASAQYPESGTYQNVLLNIVDSSTCQVSRTLYSEPSDDWPDIAYLLCFTTQGVAVGSQAA